ncbi:hypothetical protein [Halorussus halobius]|uniref:hypothetical protein n=1 Tax=Halorussus halobius TaxID=1710537 RepID=UPI001092B37F|nr:hypothetical protein [Halorussus halobius]
MANARAALARGFSVAVVLVLLLVGAAVLGGGGFAQAGLLSYLLALLLATAGAAGVWTDRYRVALVGTAGVAALALLQGAQGAFLLGLAVLLGVAVVVGYSGRTRERLDADD